ncbi:RDD family protein [Mycolicibacterium cosmeticum]|uniref:RDD domain-containing protein n=1 Tax=Mycolicibacterium cosmeticum TaxID=258533 RepID=W9BKT2_MYCCO|nr:RDD family protein [Mycolicibacterium cosmeticum]CDO08445.1 RDD domain-containing protein [Mycolicibacterium cosmeticum]
MTAVLDVNSDMNPDADAAAPDGAVVEVPVAAWAARAGALTVDVLFGVAAAAVMALLAWISPWQGWQWWLYVVVLVLFGGAVLVNRWLLPAWTGWTLGRAVAGIRVVGRTGARVGVLRLMARDIAHLLDTAALFVGWLWPLWDRRGRTFADLLLRTEVHRVDAPPRDLRKPVAVGMVATVVMCGAGAALGYGAVYRHDRAVDRARAEISQQGPRIVEQMLSYSPQTVKDDFAKAQSLATDSYRPQLVAQQNSVQKAPIVDNEYWTVNSAVTEVAPTTATMLMAMQGQRGADPASMKFITATVQVDFVESGGQWRVQNLTVITRPQPGGGPR